MSQSTIRSEAVPATTTLYAPSTPENVSSDTTITLSNGYQWNTFNHIVFQFQAGTSSSNSKGVLEIPSVLLSLGAYFPVALGSNVYTIRIANNSSVGTYTTIRLFEQTMPALYVSRIYGTK